MGTVCDPGATNSKVSMNWDRDMDVAWLAAHQLGHSYVFLLLNPTLSNESTEDDICKHFEQFLLFIPRFEQYTNVFRQAVYLFPNILTTLAFLEY